LSPADFYSTYLKKLQVLLQVKSSSSIWYFGFVFPVPPIVTDGRTARYSLKKKKKFLFILEQVPVQVAKYSEFWSLYVSRVDPHVPSVTMPPHSPQIVCKTGTLKFSIAVRFFTCALFKEYKNLLVLART